MSNIIRSNKSNKSTKSSKSRANVFPTNFSDFYTQTSTILGSGTYSKVFKGVMRKPHKQVAIKVITKKDLKKKDFKKLLQEVKILTSMTHKNIVKIFNVFEDDESFKVVMEFIEGGNLQQIVQSKTEVLSEPRARRYILQLAEALKFCHSKGVVHRDVKPENVLITDKDNVKLADFNLGRKMDTDAIKFTVIETRCGTPNYVAPEVIGADPYNFKCDIWSLGVVAYYLLSEGYLPFRVSKTETRVQALLEKIDDGIWDFYPPEKFAQVTEQGKDLLLNMIQRDPDERYDYIRVLGHPWFQIQDFMDSPEDAQQKLDAAKRKFLSCAYVLNAVNSFNSIRLPDESEEKVVEKPKIEASNAFGDTFGEFN